MRIDLSPVSLGSKAALGLLLALSGCGSSTSGGADAGAGAADGGGGAADGGVSEPGGPVFLSFAANTGTLLDGQVLTLTAVLTDPDGIDDIIGGTLLDPDSGASYGSFATSASEGSYEIALTWQQLDTVEPIHGALDTALSRSFRATFFDVAGHQASRDVTVGIDCSDDSELACGAGCQWGSDPERSCGECDHQCGSRDWSISQPQCEAGRCFGIRETETRSSCTASCAAVGYVCDPSLIGAAIYQTLNQTLNLDSCDQVPPATYPADPSQGFTAMECACVEP